jgi:hypothetical protein
MTSTTTLRYLRTPLGRAAAYTPDAKLSVALKAVLKAVDGKTSVSALVVQFPQYDAANLLSQLEDAGLIKLREERVEGFPPSGLMPDLLVWPTSTDLKAHSFAVTSAGKLAPLQAVPQDQTVARLARIIDVMATFILTHMPHEAFTLLGRLEGLQTLGQLESELPDYSKLATASGPAGVVHMADLTERLREAAAA